MKQNPVNFSWIDDFIAGSSIPRSIEHINFFIKSGITHIISLTIDSPLVMKYVKNQNLINFIHIPIYSIPNNDQILIFKKTIQDVQSQHGKIVVHCQFGQERTGIFLAIYLVCYKYMSLFDAKQVIIKKRPGSLRTSIANSFLDTLQLPVKQ